MGDRATAVARRLEPWAIALIAAHSATIGIALAFAPGWAARFGGFGAAEPLFFPRQAGAFHLVAALGYLGEYRVYGGVRLLLTAKAVATVFLVAAWIGGEGAWSVPFSAAADGAMGTSILALHAAARRGGPTAVA